MTRTVRRYATPGLFMLLALVLGAWPVVAWSDGGGGVTGTITQDQRGVTATVGAAGVTGTIGLSTGSGTSTGSGSNTSSGSSGGASNGATSSPTGQGGANSDQPTSGPPAFSRQVDAKPVRGTVRVKPPGAKSFVALSGTARLPTGSLIDTTRGAVRLVSPKAQDGGWQAAVFSAAVFKVVQKRQAKPTTDVLLAGGDFSRCAAAGARSSRTAAAAKRKNRRTVRRVRGRGHGRFRTWGRYGSASVRGTIWVTEDRCDGTLVRVQRGTVSVRDFARRRTVLVGAGHSYLVRGS
jgi:hypothetical protein